MSVSRHAGYNLLGSVIPIALSLITVPTYLKIIGSDRYGVLAIAWLLLGYFGMFDLGLGRATLFRVAALRDDMAASRADTFWAALTLNITLGMVGGLVLWALASHFFGHVFKVDERLRPEVLSAVPLLAASVPIATLSGVLTGAMQGRERFLEVNLISIISTALFQILPLGLAWAIGPYLPLLLGGAVAARLMTVAFLGFRCYTELAARHAVRVNFEEIGILVKYGGWVTLTAIFGPLLYIVDRFVIGATLGATAITDYTVPYQLAGRMHILPSALTTALFPKLSSTAPVQQAVLAEKATRTLSGLLFVPFIGAIFLIEPFLHIWVGRSLGPQAGAVGRTMLVAMWANAFALISYTRIEASGRPDRVTKIMLVQIPPYFLLLYIGMSTFGLLGAAFAAATRAVADFLLLTWVADRRIRAWRTHAGTMVFLLLAAWVAARWTITDWRGGLSALLFLGVGSAWSLRILPPEIKGQSFAHLRRQWRSWMGAWQGG